MPSRFTVVSNPAPSSSITVACSSRSVSASSSGSPTSRLTRSSPGSRRSRSKCSPQEGVHRPERPFGGDVAAERQARVEGGRRGGAPAQEVLPPLDGHPEQVGDDEDRQLGGVGVDEVDGAAAEFQRVEQGVGGPLHDGLEGGGGARGERPAHQPAEAGVVGRVDDQHGRRLRHAGRVELVAETERPADQPRCGRPVPPDAEPVGAEDLGGDRVRGRDQAEAAGQRPAGPQLLVEA